MHTFAIHNAELTLILLLALVVGFGVLAQRLKTPYPIILVIAGVVLGLLPAMPRISLNPDLVFTGAGLIEMHTIHQCSPQVGDPRAHSGEIDIIAGRRIATGRQGKQKVWSIPSHIDLDGTTFRIR